MAQKLLSLDHLTKPNASEDVAIELIRRLYGLEVIHIKRLVSFDDQNFYIQVAREHRNPHLSAISDHGYTLKITNTEKSAIDGHFDSMHDTMVHLDKKQMRVPVPVPNIDGKRWSMENVPLLHEGGRSEQPKLCGVHLLTFIPGVPVCTQEYTENVLYQWGMLLATFHNACEDHVQPILLDKAVFWSLGYLLQIKKYLEGLSPHQLQLVHSVLDQYEEKITNNLDKLSKGFIHGDFNENNVLAQVHSTHTEKSVMVDGVLDFEDVHHGTYVWDLGVTLMYALLDSKIMQPLDRVGHVLAGYLSLRSLSDLEMSLIKYLIQCRFCQSLVLCAFSYRSDPSNTYLLTTSKTGWLRLEELCNNTNEALLRRWKEIIDSYHSKN